MIRLGIDTGGTYTDAVIVEVGEGVPRVLAKSKSLTTKGDLTRGILSAIDQLPREDLERAEHAAISTTLATNACVEGKGGNAKLIIVGTTDEVLHRVDAQGTFGIPYDSVLTTPFVGSFDGSNVTVPDWEELYQQNRSFFEDADSFGIASLYALNNGAIVEKSGAEFLRERFGKVVVEATTVAAELNVIGRGATALLNARLVPVISDFLDAINEALDARNLSMPVSVVRSDGTLMSDELARIRPVETIMSGPAASVTGAQVLAGAPESLIVDIGGTTSDISIIHEGRPNKTSGIFIGGWKTQVSGVSVDTIALGGDTVVRYTKNSRLELGTRKATPLCIAAARWPQVKRKLQYYFDHSGVDFNSRYELLYLLRDPGNLERYSDTEKRILEMLREGPISLFDERMDTLTTKLARLEALGVVMRCGLTPTDAMHLKGDFGVFDTEASLLGARCLLKSYRGKDEALDDAEVAKLADEIYDLARYRLFGQVIGAFAQDKYWPGDPTALDNQMKAIVRHAWDTRCDDSKQPFSLSFSGTATLVGVGAPTHVFLDEVGEALNIAHLVPENAEVANAIGAAASTISVEQSVQVIPLRGSDGVVQGYQVRGLDKSVIYEELEEALDAARAQVRRQTLDEARRRGAQGDLDCEIVEGRMLYDAMGVMETVRAWTFTGRVDSTW